MLALKIGLPQINTAIIRAAHKQRCLCTLSQSAPGVLCAQGMYYILPVYNFSRIWYTHLEDFQLRSASQMFKINLSLLCSLSSLWICEWKDGLCFNILAVRTDGPWQTLSLQSFAMQAILHFTHAWTSRDIGRESVGDAWLKPLVNPRQSSDTSSQIGQDFLLIAAWECKLDVASPVPACSPIISSRELLLGCYLATYLVQKVCDFNSREKEHQWLIMEKCGVFQQLASWLACKETMSACYQVSIR